MSVNDLGFDFTSAAPWFPHSKTSPYVLVKVDQKHAKAWANTIGHAVRRCYVSDLQVEERTKVTGLSSEQLIKARLPDPGSTMAGDFGEILVYFYQASKLPPGLAIGPKKWRLKQDRTKPAPFSDVVHFVLPSWPKPCANDEIYCSEVKTKSTDGDSSPIKSAIEDSAKDRTSRLAKTLVWLRERALFESLGEVEIAHLDRFINATENPAAKKHYRAVAVICNSFLKAELSDAPKKASQTHSVIIIAVPDLQKIYMSVFEAAQKALPGKSLGSSPKGSR